MFINTFSMSAGEVAAIFFTLTFTDVVYPTYIDINNEKEVKLNIHWHWWTL